MRARHTAETRAKIREGRAPYTRALRAAREQQDAAVATRFGPILAALCKSAFRK